MARVLLVADDLTGANAAAASFARRGLPAATVASVDDLRRWDETASRVDVVVVNTASRHLPPGEAAARVAAVVATAGPVELIGNRIDTTMRGNVGATTAALLDAVSGRTGRRAVCFCAPAHPDAGRFTLDGSQLLDGERLEHTEVARDPRAPVPSSDVAANIGRQSSLRVVGLPLVAVRGPVADLRALIAAHVAGGADVLVADALTLDDLDRAARATVDALSGSSDAPMIVTTDPGPGSVAMALALGLRRSGVNAPLLAVSASASASTRRQLRRLATERDVTVVNAVTPAGRAVPDADACVRALDAALARQRSGGITLIATAMEEADVSPLDPDEGDAIATELARAVRAALDHHEVGGIYSTGGDMSAALLDALGARGVEITGEVVPLAAVGTLVGGAWHGLPIVTKGGLVGDDETAVACLDRLRADADRQGGVRSAGDTA